MLFISIFFIHLCVLVVPGPDFLLNSRTRLTGNKKAVIQVVTGTTLGAIIWALFSLLGLHLIFQYYPFLRELVLFGGLVYLFYLAFQIYRSADLPLPAEHGIGHSYFFTGLLTNLTNPKALLYFSSIFSIIHFGSNPSTVFFIFIMITLETLIWFLFVGLAFSHSGIQAFYQIYKSRIDRLSACVFIMFACSIIFKLFVK